MRSGSLRLRVTLAVIGVLAVVILALAVVVDALFGQQTVQDQANVLRDRVQLARQLEGKRLTTELLYERLSSGGLLLVRITDPSGQARGPKPDNRAAETPAPQTLTYRNGTRITIFADAESKPQARLRRLLVIVSLVTLAVGALVVVLTVRFAVGPLEAMGRLARSIANGNRGRRLAPDRRNTDIGRTAAAFDDMLDALEGAEAQARGSEERTRQFVADAAHELRTPIAGVQAVAESVLQQGADVEPEERERMMLLLVRESRRAGRLVDDLVALARIEAGIDLQRKPVDLHALAEAEADRTRVLAPELTVQVSGTQVTVQGDPHRLAQVLANLMNNARQAVQGTGRITVTVGTADLGAHGRFAELIVADDGPGVPPAERERIFDRLVRLDESRAGRSGGSGLGLPIARGICRVHGGDLRCEAPAPGQPGAVFRILLPLPAALDAPTVAFAPATTPLAVPPPVVRPPA
ncbi:HAMP domain-containing sensor histidine kinase [Kutzneria viridogrisea]|uniref:histidine kinase n=2 Tax=Kutzneria TaxID=43356 RepID=W5W863_9PSEU|nr:HAMP domain-containing sensor histidine kinase [Kutzneria albida]AHH94414.1 histidine kinase [Kutzneria albida DSM 43870]MBA8930081.1 signal transduction histidine kinase [Kutzneria viridogrisea]